MIAATITFQRSNPGNSWACSCEGMSERPAMLHLGDAIVWCLGQGAQRIRVNTGDNSFLLVVHDTPDI